MAVVRWTFYDPVTSETWQFNLNPKEGGSLQYEKNLTYEVTTDPDGKTLIFEGRDQPMESSFSGTILEEDHYNALLTWWQKRRQIRLTDDLNRQMWIYIKSFAPKRQRTVHYPWRHEYEVTFVIIDW